MSPSNHFSRRAVLATGAALVTASSAGCTFSEGASKGATDVVVYNETNDAKSVAVTITDARADRAAPRDTQLQIRDLLRTPVVE